MKRWMTMMNPIVMWRFLPIHKVPVLVQPPAPRHPGSSLHAYLIAPNASTIKAMYALLNYACGNHASREVIRLLLMSLPDAARRLS
jgi:hypothetical protein